MTDDDDRLKRYQINLRARLHSELDTWLDRVIAHPLRMSEGELHAFQVRGDFDNGFTVKRSEEESV